MIRKKQLKEDISRLGKRVDANNKSTSSKVGAIKPSIAGVFTKLSKKKDIDKLSNSELLALIAKSLRNTSE